jgi:hypothetical protein
VGEQPMALDDAKLVNLAFRVGSVDAAEAAVAALTGWSAHARHALGGGTFLEARFGNVRVNFFADAIYDEGPPPAAGSFLHASFSVPDLDRVLDDRSWRDKLVWGPETIQGGFGRRRIAFFEPIPGCRIELMEELDA